MTDKYSKQDGQPLPESTESENALETGAGPTTVNDRSTEEKTAGQGLGQISDVEAARRTDFKDEERVKERE